MHIVPPAHPGHPVGLALPAPGAPATNAIFQPVSQAPQRPLSARLEDPRLPLSELRAAFDDALGGEWVDPGCAAGELLAEIATRRRNEPDAELQATLQLHRMLFAALGSRLQEPEAHELRLLGGLLVERLEHGWIMEPMYRRSMHQLAERFLELAQQGPYRDLAIDPRRHGLEARGACLDALETSILRHTRELALIFSGKGCITDRDVPKTLTNQLLSDYDEAEWQNGVDRAAFLFDFFAAHEGLPEDCMKATREIMKSRAPTSEQLQATATAPPSEPSLNLPLPPRVHELARQAPLVLDFGERDPYLRKHKVSLGELTELLVYAYGGPSCSRTGAYEQVRAMLLQAAETRREPFPERVAGRALEEALLEVLRLRLDPSGTEGMKLSRGIDQVQEMLNRHQCDYATFLATVRALLRDFARSAEGQAGGVAATNTP